MAAAFSRALGQEVAYNAVEPEVYRSLGFPGGDDVRWGLLRAAAVAARR
jgi:hypothetical protein